MIPDDFLDRALAARGLRVPKHLRGSVRKRLAKRIKELELTLDDYRARLEQDPDESTVFEQMCRVTISRFYRDREVFNALAPLLRDGVRVWSAGCASGEEPYTIAMMCPGAVILATDADQRVLERARRGCYPAGSLRELPASMRTAAFVRTGDLYCLRDEYRRAVTFRCEDLRETIPDGPFDLILCRNLAFTYFDEPTQRTIADALVARVRAGGALVIGAHEQLPAGTELHDVTRL